MISEGMRARLAALLLLSAAAPAFAQAEAEAEADVAAEGEERAEVEAEAEAAPEAAPEAEDAPDPRLEEARDRFRQGLALARAGNCRGAIAELNASLEIVERPNTLYNIARCHEELFRYDLAVRSYERYLAIAPAEAEDRAAVEATMRSLSNLLGTIVVASNVEAEVWIGDRVVGRAPGEVLVPGGRHAIELRAEGYIAARREVEVAGRGRASVSFELEQAEVTNVTNVTNVEGDVNITEEGGAPPAVFYTTLGLTAAAGVAALAFGARAIASSGRTENLDPLDRAGIEAGNQRTKDAQLLTDVFLGVAGAFAVTTVVLYFLTDFDGDPDPDEARERERESREAEVTPSAWVGPGAGGVAVQGRF